MKTAIFAVSAMLALQARDACADSSFWQRARDPRAYELALTANRVERILGSLDLPELDAEFSAAAIAITTLSRMLPKCREGEAPPLERRRHHARFEYLIGRALLEAERPEEARCILKRALEHAPHSPLAAEGWSNLGNVEAKLGNPSGERLAYERALESTWKPDARSALRSNLAESEMMALDLKRAVRDYRLAIGEARSPETAALGYFGLSVALDRAGDLPSALAAASRAEASSKGLVGLNSVLDMPGVFFTPSYEIHYYKALAAMAAARDASEERARRDALGEAVDYWELYLAGAERDGTPWVSRARLHRLRVRAELGAVRSSSVKSAAAPSAEAPL